MCYSVFYSPVLQSQRKSAPSLQQGHIWPVPTVDSSFLVPKAPAPHTSQSRTPKQFAVINVTYIHDGAWRSLAGGPCWRPQPECLLEHTFQVLKLGQVIGGGVTVTAHLRVGAGDAGVAAWAVLAPTTAHPNFPASQPPCPPPRPPQRTHIPGGSLAPPCVPPDCARASHTLPTRGHTPPYPPSLPSSPPRTPHPLTCWISCTTLRSTSGWRDTSYTAHATVDAVVSWPANTKLLTCCMRSDISNITLQTWCSSTSCKHVVQAQVANMVFKHEWQTWCLSMSCLLV